MAMDFPLSPSVGQASNGYVWDGTTWNRQFAPTYIKPDGSVAFTGKQSFPAATAASASLRVLEATATPTTPAVGDVLLSSDSHLYWYHGAAWHAAVKLDGDTMTGTLVVAQNNATRAGLRIPQATTNPATPVTGDIAHNTDGSMYWHTLGNWRRFLYDGDTAASAMAFTAAGAAITVKNASFGGIKLYSNVAASGIVEFTSNANTVLGSINGDASFMNFNSANGRGVLLNNLGNGANYWLCGTSGTLNLRGHATIMRINFENSNATPAGGYIKYDWTSSPVIGLLLSNANGHIWQLREDGYLITNGNISASTVSANNFYGVYNPPSDQRIKDVHGPFTMGLQELLELDLVEYSFKPSTGIRSKVRPGVVAQQAERTALGPMLVDQGELMIGGQVIPDLKTIEPDVLIFTLINAVRTLDARVKELESQRSS